MKLIGDLIHDVTSFLGIKECSGCKRRRKKLNAAHAKLKGRGGRKTTPCVECAKVRRIG
jgi:hypothetical protein